MKTFVCGHPIKHSRSPIIHNYWLKEHGIDGSYSAVDVAPDGLHKHMDAIRSGEFLGGNFTLPHKEAVFHALNRRDAAAEAIGAVNTVWLENGELVGGNTDAYGFAANLDDQIPQWRSASSAMVFGAGGASRAIIFALKKAGISRIHLINRTIERAQKLAHEFAPLVSAHTWGEAEKLVPKVDLIINTTAIGMDRDEGFPIDLSDAMSGALAADIVYIPLRTPFLEAAAQVGIQTSDGLGMLLHQAVPGFEKWYGVRPEVTDELRQLIIKDMAAKNQQ